MRQAQPTDKESHNIPPRARQLRQANLSTWLPASGLANAPVEFLRICCACLLLCASVVGANAAAAEPEDIKSVDAKFLEAFKAKKYSEALPLATRLVELAETAYGKSHRSYVIALQSLADTHRILGNYDKALPLYESARKIAPTIKEIDARMFARILSGYGKTLVSTGRTGEAVEVYKLQLLNLDSERLLAGKPNPDYMAALGDIAHAYSNLGDKADAALYWKRLLSFEESQDGRDSASVATTLTNIATTMRDDDDRFEEAKALEERALQIRLKVLDQHDPMIGISYLNRAQGERIHGNLLDAKALATRAVETLEASLSDDHEYIGSALMARAKCEKGLGDFESARADSQRALDIFIRGVGPKHRYVAYAHDELGGALLQQGKAGEAIAHFKEAVKIYGSDAASAKGLASSTLSQLGIAELAENDIPAAMASLESSLNLFKKRFELSPDKEQFGVGISGSRDELRRTVGYYLSALGRSSGLGAETPDVALEKSFAAVQLGARGSASLSVSQLASRFATGDSELAKLVRNYQDTGRAYRAADQKLTEALGAQKLGTMDSVLVSLLRSYQELSARKLDLQRKLINQRFPAYGNLVDPKALTISEVRDALEGNEAMVVYDVDSENAHVWVITKSDAKWGRLNISSKSIEELVLALRCGLDSAAWAGDGQVSCQKALGLGYTRNDADKGLPLPFDVAKAHALYSEVLRPYEALIGDKHLLIIPSGPLAQLPFHVLVTESAASALASYKEAAWLVKRNPISLLPSVASLRSLRAYAKPSKAPKPFLGFGNPLLDGDPAQRPWEAKWAKIAREKQACSSAPPHKTAGAGTRQLGPSLIATRSGRADVAHIKAQTPLYETADELCEVAASLGAAAEDVRLGARATEKAVRELSAANRLADYRILHFATHGILAAESRWLMHESAKREWSFKPQTAEPGLILTPPEAATREEDGLLAMSEIAELNLDADWAVLSACNTAGGANIGDSEAFSGLASAFLYAGARAVLASQWYVDSRAAVKITTETFRSLSSEPSAGRAEALRRAILAAMTDPDRTKEEGPADHPSVWGPFVLVGEGGAGR